MKMISKVGALHTLPKPSTAVMDAAIGMLTVFGDPQKLKKLLTEIRDVQEHNEQVFKDASAALSDISKREKALGQAKTDFDLHSADRSASLNIQATNLKNSEHRLATRISTFEQNEAQRDQELTERKAELDLGHEDLKVLLKTYEGNKLQLDNIATALDDREQRNDANRQKLKAREARLRAALDSS